MGRKHSARKSSMDMKQIKQIDFSHVVIDPSCNQFLVQETPSGGASHGSKSLLSTKSLGSIHSPSDQQSNSSGQPSFVPTDNPDLDVKQSEGTGDFTENVAGRKRKRTDDGEWPDFDCVAIIPPLCVGATDYLEYFPSVNEDNPLAQEDATIEPSPDTVKPSAPLAPFVTNFSLGNKTVTVDDSAFKNSKVAFVMLYKSILPVDEATVKGMTNDEVQQAYYKALVQTNVLGSEIVGRNETHVTEIQDLIAENLRLKDRLQQLEAENSKLKAENPNRKAVKKELEIEIARLKAEISFSFEEHETEICNIKDRIVELEAAQKEGSNKLMKDVEEVMKKQIDSQVQTVLKYLGINVPEQPSVDRPKSPAKDC